MRLRAGLPVAGHRHEDDSRVGGAQILVVEPQLADDVRAVVLEDDVGDGSQPQRQLAAALRLQIDGAAELVAVVVVEVGGLIPTRP
jgi:hypothetical protein